MRHVFSFYTAFLLFLISSGSIFSQQIINGPYLANPGETTMTIRWESDAKGNFHLDYGTGNKMKRSAVVTLAGQKDDHFLYEATLNNLKAGTKYNYSISSEDRPKDRYKNKSGDKSEDKSELHFFKTIGPKPPMTFAVLGDSRSKEKIFSAIASLICETDPAVIIANGDIVAKGGSAGQWHSQFFEPSKKMIDHIPFLSAVGDHESDNVDGDSAKLFTYYLFPGKDNMKLWFSYDIGNAHFIFLDWRYPGSKEMAEWFRKDVTASDKKWKFVVMHRPPYNLGGHHVSWGKNIWPDLFQKYRIDVVFSGHSHLYERFYPIKPVTKDSAWAVTYITTGGAGASLYEATPAPSLAYTKSINHFLKVILGKNNIDIKAIGVNGEVLDSVSWSKKKENIDTKYLSKAFPKEEMDIINVFNSPISARIDKIPMVHVPYAPVIELDGRKITEDVNFTIHLAKESEGKYKMVPVTGILKAGTTLKIQPEIYGRSTMTVSKWGTLSPVLRLIADYKTRSFKGSVKGVRLEYISY